MRLRCETHPDTSSILQFRTLVHNNGSDVYYRYLELVHPIWHKTHFKIKWVYISFPVIWFCNLILTTHQIYISKLIAYTHIQTSGKEIIESLKKSKLEELLKT